MGNSQSIYIYAVNDPRSISLDKLQEIIDSENRKVWKNPLTGEQYQELGLSINKTKSLQAEIILFERRRQQEIGLPIVHYIQNIKTQDYFNRENNEFKVFVEFLPVRLNQISTIPLSSGLYILQKAFVGFGGLFNEVGYFDIKQEFIGINKDHQPKFWFNSSWAQNQPQITSQLSINIIYLQSLMVNKIFQIIEQHINKQQMRYYRLHKQKIKQWTFKLGAQFILQFSKQHCLNLPNKISYNIKYTETQTQKYYYNQNQTARKQFYVKNPKYSIMINIPEPTNSQITDRINTSNNMFKSVYQSNDSNQFLNVKNQQVYSPKSTGERPKFFGLNFKQSFCNNSRNKSARNQNSITKSYLALSKIVKGMNISQRKQKLDNKIKQLKQSKHQGDKQFISNRRKHSHFTTSFTNNNQTSYQSKQIVVDKKEQKHQMSQQFIHKFREGKDKQNKQFNKKCSLNQQNQKLELNNVRKRQDTNYSSTLASSQLHSPTNKERAFAKNCFVDCDNYIPFCQSINQPMTNSNEIKKQQRSFLLRGASTKQSDYEKPQLKTQVSDFCSEDDRQRAKTTVLTESIILDQMAIKSSNITNRPLLGMLDQLVMKKAIQKSEGQLNEQQFLSMKNSNAMTHSIIEQT